MDPDQLASEKPADQDLLVFKIYLYLDLSMIHARFSKKISLKINNATCTIQTIIIHILPPCPFIIHMKYVIHQLLLISASPQSTCVLNCVYYI